MDKNTENLIDRKIDELAIAMHKGFESIDKRFESIDKRFEGVEGEINSIRQDVDKRFEEMEKQSQDRHNELMNSNDKMIRIFEASQQELASERFISGKQEKKLENHEKRIKFLELRKAI